MKAELQNHLIEKYREFFEYLEDHKGPIIPIQFGFECGDGWYMLLDELMANIKNHIWNENNNRKNRPKYRFIRWLDNRRYRLPWKRKRLKKLIFWIVDKFPRGLDPMPPINITQIKEKFGGLCFYYYGGDNYIYGLTSLAESLSYKICESCGTTKDVGQTQGWIYTVCKDCLKNSKDRIQEREWVPVKEAGLLENTWGKPGKDIKDE